MALFALYLYGFYVFGFYRHPCFGGHGLLPDFRFPEIYAVASTSSDTLHLVFVTPAAMAGVQRSVLCRLTKL